MKTNEESKIEKIAMTFRSALDKRIELVVGFLFLDAWVLLGVSLVDGSISDHLLLQIVGYMILVHACFEAFHFMKFAMRSFKGATTLFDNCICGVAVFLGFLLLVGSALGFILRAIIYLFDLRVAF